MEVFHIEFQQYLWNGLWNKGESPFMALRKSGCLVNQNAWKQELSDKVSLKFPLSNFNICKWFTGKVENFVCAHMQTSLYYGSIKLRIAAAGHLLMKVFLTELENKKSM
jgi:hypothetical protein